MDERDRADLEVALRAHCAWLTENEIHLGDGTSDEHLSIEPADVSAASVLFALETSNVANEPKLKRTAMAVLRSLMALCSLRSRFARERIVETLEKQLKNARRSASPDQRPQLRRDAKAQRAVLGESPSTQSTLGRCSEAETRIGYVQNSFAATRREIEKRRKELETAGLKELGDPAAKRQFLAIDWMEARSRQFVEDLKLLCAELSPEAARPILGHPGPLKPKTWSQLRNECLLLIKNGGGSASLQQRLFPFGNTDQNRAKSRHRREEAQRRSKSIS